ncbi:chaperonin 10-like protein [Plectosphaerella plurivora]|uniref:L-arabinitol 4-dehydrogenase n=1 Tax=Plectosphaerella plurivora TaxID=936078 RepID=A0A9P9ACI8_9PEZI|nr:chaperonin 10-like protein [Plectosphaerella plurivora]
MAVHIADDTERVSQAYPTDSAAETIRQSEAFVLEKVGKFRFEERDESRPCAAAEVVVRIVATGICGSDVHWWQHGQIGDTSVTGPIILGHESSGIVEACGSKIKHLKPGDRIALEPGAGCNTCIDCRAGKYNLCADMKFAATPPYDGTLATFYRLPEECCFPIPAHVTLEEAALVEPLAVAVHCCRLGQIGPGSRVAIFGAGPIGLLTGAVAKAFGAARIVMIDIIQTRLDIAKSFLGVETYNSANEFNREALLDRIQTQSGVDVVVEATGNETCVIHGVDVLKRGGKFVQAGLGPSKISFPVGQICSKEAAFLGSFRYGPGDYQLAVDLLSSGKVSVKELITGRYEFKDAEQAFKDAASRKGIKSIIYGPSVAGATQNGLLMQ